MKKIFFINLVFISFTNLYALSSSFIEKMSYESDYNKALTEAKKQNKGIMMVVSQKSCPWCRKMERQTLNRVPIDKLIKSKFIPLLLDEQDANFPKKFEAKVFPTTFFIDAKSEELISKVLGYKGKNEFKKIVEELVK